jgi:hypothetical protein
MRVEMKTCKGIVKDNVVVLEEGASLPDGTEVEVRMIEVPLSREEAFRRVLANPIRHSVAMDEILEEEKREREERIDEWLRRDNG